MYLFLKGCSHLHSFWLTEKIVESVSPLKLKKYKDRMNDRDEKTNEHDEEELFHTTVTNNFNLIKKYKLLGLL